MSGSSHYASGMHRVPKIKGQEAMAYLSYIVDHYDALPALMAFVRPNRTAWNDHSPGSDNVEALQTLNLNVVQERGYANLRCSWTPGCPNGVQAYSRQFGKAQVWETHMPTAWRSLFGDHLLFPGTLGAASGSQFVVPRWQVLRRPKYAYVQYREWLMDTNLNSQDSGKIFEFLWHIIFGRTAAHCPDEYRCACDQFGRC